MKHASKPMTKRVSEILSWYPALTPKQRQNFAHLLQYGRTGGSGKLVILPVDQGFEHGPARSFMPNPAGYDPRYHAQLAIDAGCNAYAAPLGALEAAADIIAKHKLPTILKATNHDLMLPDGSDPVSVVTAEVDDAVRLGCVAIGMTIYFGSVHTPQMYAVARKFAAEAREAGLIFIIWAYPRGSGLSGSQADTAVDVVSYAVHLSAQLGAHIIKCKPPTAVVAMPDYIKRELYKDTPLGTVADRIKLVVQAAFNGRRLVINSGMEQRNAAELLQEVRQLKEGGSSGSIVGRNSFQRPHDEAVKLLHQIQDIYLA